MADSQAQGDGGNIIINAGEQIKLEGLSEQGFPSQIVAGLTSENAEGMGGTIEINAGELVLDDVAFISSNTVNNTIGSAGSITVNVDNLRISNNAFINVFTGNDFDGGSITINAQTLDLLSGGKILAATDGKGNAGNINLNISDRIRIDNGIESSAELVDFGESSQLLNDLQEFSSGIYANATENATGSGGNINIGMLPGQAPLSFLITNDAQIIVSSEGTGNGGNIFLRSQALELDNNATISASTAFGQGGEITLELTDDLALNNNSSISAEAFNDADGGNLNIDTRFIIAFPNGNNDILASADQGQGGNITINAESLLGIRERLPSDSTNDIDASGSVDGKVIINTPDVDITKELVETPQNVVEPEQTVAQACRSDYASRTGKDNGIAQRTGGLTIEGKGGVPPEPIEPLNSDNILVDGQVTNPSPQTQHPEIKPIKTSKGDIFPARGIVKTEDGRIILTAYPTNSNTNRIPHGSTNCS